jgi:hypothetical protein
MPDSLVLKDLSDVHFAGAEKIVLVQDNLNTHNPASLYEAFSPTEARRRGGFTCGPPCSVQGLARGATRGE